MRIAIDYTAAIAQHAGIGRYTRSLVAALARIDDADDMLLFSTEAPTASRPFAKAPNLRSRVISVAGRPVGNRAMTLLWHRLRVPLPVEAFIGRAQVLHAPDFSLPPAPLTPRVVTIHDLAFLTNPECALPSLVDFLGRVVPRAVRSADRIIAVSETTANDLVRLLNVPREKVRVIHLGVEPRFAPVSDDTIRARVEQVYGLRHPLILAVGTIEPRKNYPRLIEAFARMRTQAATESATGASSPMLAIAGRKGWLYDAVFQSVERLGLADCVRFLDYVADDDLPALYSLADVVAMPSLYEGFGIPVVEAMACGTPVVCGNTGSLPEIAGSAALLVDPLDVDAIAGALRQALFEGEVRERLSTQGRQRAAQFNWETAAAQHLSVYREIARSGRAS